MLGHCVLWTPLLAPPAPRLGQLQPRGSRWGGGVGKGWGGRGALGQFVGGLGWVRALVGAV